MHDTEQPGPAVKPPGAVPVPAAAIAPAVAEEVPATAATARAAATAKYLAIFVVRVIGSSPVSAAGLMPTVLTG